MMDQHVGGWGWWRLCNTPPSTLLRELARAMGLLYQQRCSFLHGVSMLVTSVRVLQDADSVDPEGKKTEGAFYLWSADEVAEALGGGARAKLFAARYGMRAEGNCTLSPRRCICTCFLAKHHVIPRFAVLSIDRDPSSVLPLVVQPRTCTSLCACRSCLQRPCEEQCVLTDDAPRVPSGWRAQSASLPGGVWLRQQPHA